MVGAKPQGALGPEFGPRVLRPTSPLGSSSSWTVHQIRSMSGRSVLWPARCSLRRRRDLKASMIAAAVFATLIVTSMTDADARPGFRGGGYRGGGYRGVAVGRGYHGGIGRPGWGAAGPIAGRPGWRGAGRPRLGRGGPNRRAAGLGALWISALWRLSWLRLRLSSVRLWLGGGWGCGRSRRGVLRRLRTLCLLRPILRRLSLLLIGNTSFNERRFGTITSPARVRGG